MQIMKLTKEQIEYVYKNYMIIDFPDDEIKPLRIIMDSIERGLYEGFGCMKDGQMIGYALLSKVEGEKHYLLDYLAISSKERNCGIGSIFLKLLAKHYEDASSLIVEVENPDFADNEAERILQKRRIDFYIRNGYRKTGVELYMFGVHYIIIELGTIAQHSKNEVTTLHKRIYLGTMPEKMFKANLKYYEAEI